MLGSAIFAMISVIVDALRLLMIRGGTTVFGLALDYGVQVGTLIVLVILGANFHPRVVN